MSKIWNSKAVEIRILSLYWDRRMASARKADPSGRGKIDGGGVEAIRRRAAQRGKYLRTPEGRAEMAAKRAAREKKKAQAAAGKAYWDSLVTRKDLIEKYGCSEKEVAKLRHPDEVKAVRGMGWGQNGRRYLYRLSNPEVGASLHGPYRTDARGDGL